MAQSGRTSPREEVTPESVYRRRREFLKDSLLFTATSLGVGGGLLSLVKGRRSDQPSSEPPDASRLDFATGSTYDTREAKTRYRDVTSYNNFYEFGVDKDEPAARSRGFQSRPWTLAIDGEVSQAMTVDVDQLTRWFPLEERVYRMRCVEAWSMVIPWIGFPLGDLLKRVEPTSRARYVAFTTLYDPQRMPGQAAHVLDWPYVEGLRLDEAMHPLAILAVGLYGRWLPSQNGAPLRLVVPWKYGFKGIKSIVKIRLTAEQPPSTWSVAGPSEYGFYANVNPAVDHPRWSQGTERRIGELRRRPTLPFNGYADQVAGLYAGMDLRRFF